MFMHNKRLQYTVRVSQPDPVLAGYMLEQFGGPQGELAAAMRYFTQSIAESDPGRKDLLMDIATEELSHLEVIGSIVAMLNRGVKAQMAEGAMEEAEMYRAINRGGESHTMAILGGGGTALFNSAGVPWTAAYIDTIGEPTADLRSNIAAEARAKIVYERLINVTDDQNIKEALGFLMTREVAHQKSFEKALYAIENNFPPGKLSGMREFTDKYYDMSQGSAGGITNQRGPWNQGNQWEYVEKREDQYAVDGGDGSATVELPQADAELLDKAAIRTKSEIDVDPTTGADLGAGLGAGKTKKTR
ncbi:MAG TPA: manganese catalase family protein [Gammaproteobacteria bacterium]|nr:manganese catalase family protein [Gammaproteobacteria bacterium]